MSSLVESIREGVVIKFVASGEIEVDLDSSLNSLNPLSPPYVSIIILTIYFFIIKIIED